MIELSVIVCTYNREKYIGNTLQHLANQNVDNKKYEVIIVDNNSSDGTSQICDEFLTNNPSFDGKYFKEISQGHTYARNRGIKESSAKILAFIDDDAFVKSDYAENIIVFFREHTKVMAIGGKIIPKYEGEAPNWMTPYLLPLVSAIDMGENIKPFKGTKFPIGANMAFRRSVFETYGLFDVSLGRRGSGLEGADEKELIYRLKNAKAQVYYVPNVVVAHIIPQQRLTRDYISGLAYGVAKSEIKRLKRAPKTEYINKVVSELIKVGGTIVLSIMYFFRFEFAKATMLLKFRYWVVRGFFI